VGTASTISSSIIELPERAIREPLQEANQETNNAVPMLVPGQGPDSIDDPISIDLPERAILAPLLEANNALPMLVQGQGQDIIEDPITIFGNFLNNTLPSNFRTTDPKFFQLSWKIWNDEMGTSKIYENQPDLRKETVPDPKFTEEDVREGIVCESILNKNKILTTKTVTT
jgi:hypothetical protein